MTFPDDINVGNKFVGKTKNYCSASTSHCPIPMTAQSTYEIANVPPLHKSTCV